MSELKWYKFSEKLPPCDLTTIYVYNPDLSKCGKPRILHRVVCSWETVAHANGNLLWAGIPIPSAPEPELHMCKFEGGHCYEACNGRLLLYLKGSVFNVGGLITVNYCPICGYKGRRADE